MTNGGSADEWTHVGFDFGSKWPVVDPERSGDPVVGTAAMESLKKLAGQYVEAAPESSSVAVGTGGWSKMTRAQKDAAFALIYGAGSNKMAGYAQADVDMVKDVLGRSDDVNIRQMVDKSMMRTDGAAEARSVPVMFGLWGMIGAMLPVGTVRVLDARDPWGLNASLAEADDKVRVEKGRMIYTRLWSRVDLKDKSGKVYSGGAARLTLSSSHPSGGSLELRLEFRGAELSGEKAWRTIFVRKLGQGREAYVRMPESLERVFEHLPEFAIDEEDE